MLWKVDLERFTNSLSQRFSSNHSSSPSLSLEKAILLGDLQEVQTLLAKEAAVNRLLPNGELPLHCAIRLKNKPMVELLLSCGSDPALRDDQYQNALDHAILMQDERIASSILGNEVSKEWHSIYKQAEQSGTVANVSQLFLNAKSIFNVEINRISPISWAAYHGDIEGMIGRINLHDSVNEIDDRGMTPLHYAILGGRLEAFKSLITLGADISIVDNDKNTVLHFAALGNSKPILQRIIHSSLDLNHQNCRGETALHYAAARSNFRFVDEMIKAGADLRLKDNAGMSALMILVAIAIIRDPLRLSRPHILLCAGIITSWLASVVLSGTQARYVDIAESLIQFISMLAIRSSEAAIMLNNLDMSWKKTLAWAGIYGMDLIPPINYGFQAWKTYHISRDTLSAVRACWTNMRYRRWSSLRNLIVYKINAVYEIKKLWQTCVSENGAFAFTQTVWNLAKAHWNNDKDAYSIALAGLIKIYNQTLGIDLIDPCQPIAPDRLEEDHLLRIMNLRLVPTCPEHAGMMLDPKYDWSKRNVESLQQAKTLYRQLSLLVHPDKLKEDLKAKYGDEPFIRLNQAIEFLEKHLGAKQTAVQ